MEYEVVEGNSSLILEENVKRRLEQGWELQGGVSVTTGSDYNNVAYSYAQAMIRRDDDE
jgi:hypothetical protein